MSKSLKDQLLALGLAKEASAKPKPAHRDQRSSRPGLKNKSGAPTRKKTPGVKTAAKPAASSLTLEEAYQLREQHTRQQADLARELKQQEDRRRRQLNKDISAIVKPNRLNDPAAELSRNFMYKGRIRKVNVTAAQLKSLNEGELGLIYLAGGYHLLTPEYVAQVRLLSEDHIPDLSGSSDEDEDHPVPDDLIW